MAVNELDMQIREIKPEYKYVEKLYAVNPLIGNALISNLNMEKIYSQAKQILDKLVENPSLGSAVPTNWHLFLTLATINYAKKWNAQEESRFTKYITMQFGYRDDNGKVWGVISNSLEKAFSVKKRFFFKDAGGREFYETVLVHSFAPENAWNSVFDLLYDFLKNNLRWNYIQGDPLVGKMITVLNARMNGASSDEEDLIISSSEYRIKIGAKRLIQNRPEYTEILFGNILDRMNELLHNQNPIQKTYVDQLVDSWFAKKISRMLEPEKKQLTSVSRKTKETALSYGKIRVYTYLKDTKMYIHVPVIRLAETGHKYAEIKVYESGRLIGKTIPEIYGNELGETLNESEIPVNLTADCSGNINVQIFCDGELIFDSKKTLFRKLFIFRNSKECSINSLKQGSYEIYTPTIDELHFENVSIQSRTDKYLSIVLEEDFKILLGDKILAMDIANIQELELVEPAFVDGTLFAYNNDEFYIAESLEGFKIFADKSFSVDNIKFFVNGQEKTVSDLWSEESEGYVCDLCLSDIAHENTLVEVVIYNLAMDAIVYKKLFFVVSQLRYRFNRDFYLNAADYEDSKIEIKLCGEDICHSFSSAETEIRQKLCDGEIVIEIPSIKYEWANIKKVYPGENIWKDDIVEDSCLLISQKSKSRTYVEIGERRYSDSKINLYQVVFEENQSAYNLPIILVVDGEKKKLGQLIFSEMFTQMPEFQYEEGVLSWDGGINFIGDASARFLLQLYTDDELAYEIPFEMGASQIILPSDFEDGEYTYFIVKESDTSNIIAQDSQFFGNPNKFRFDNKVIQINEVTEDVGEGSKPQNIKPVYIEKIRFIERKYVDSEEGIFDIYEGQMFFYRMDGTKKYYSRKYDTAKNISFYKINPVKIIYINERLLRIVNEDDEGLYCYDNFGTTPRLEITDREPPILAKNYKDILFYIYETQTKAVRNIPHAQVATQQYSNEVSIFDKFELVTQEEVICAPVSKRMVINAGPGTGKTWTLIEKIIYLVEKEGIDPETILVLCFSKAAVEVIKSRLSNASTEGRVSDIINLVDVRTFDSFASQVLYYIKDDSEYDNLQYYEIGRLNYDERISLFTNVIKSIPEVISKCEHLFVDEVQDLVKDRARMVIELIRTIPSTAGVTLLGDSCQSIYDYQVGTDNMTSKQFYTVIAERMEKFSYYTFSRNHRQEQDLAVIGDEYRKVILTGNLKKCDVHWNDVVSKRIPEFDEYDVRKIELNHLESKLEHGTIGILTRTNGQALKIAALLREKGIEHVLRKRLSDNSLNRWIALLFNNYSLTSISDEEFCEEYEVYSKDNRVKDVYDVWNALRDAARSSSERIGVREILKGITTGARSPLLFTEDQDSQITVTNIHRGKGREFDTVLVENDIFEEEEKPLEEHKVCYVALTRPKTEIFRVDAKADFMRIDKDGDRRCFMAKFVGYNKQRLTNFEVGVSTDVDLRSFVRIDGVQEYIRNNFDALEGKSIVLMKDKYDADYTRYKIIVEADGKLVGYTSRDFFESLTRALRSVYHLPSTKSLYYNVYPDRFSDIYVEDIISVVEQSDGSEKGVTNYGEMVTWNAINIVGYSKVEYL